MDENFNIVPGYGVGTLKFGMSREEVEGLLGAPDEKVAHNDPDDPETGKTATWNYWRKGISVYFEEEDDYRLGCMEVEGGELFIWEENVYGFSKEKIENLSARHGFTELEVEKDEHDECLSINAAGLNFFFEEDEVISVQAGVLIDDDDECCWPL